MRQRRPFSFLILPGCALALGGAILVTGCGGGGGNGNDLSSNTGSLGTNSGSSGTGTGGIGTGTGGTTPTLTAAETSLNGLVQAPNSATLTNLAATAAQFDQARQAAPTNKDAQLGYAISEAALSGAQFANLSGTVVPALRSPKAASAVPAIRAAQIAQSLTLWKLPHLLSASGKTAWPRATDFLPTSALAARVSLKSRTVSPAQVQTALVALDTQLVSVEQALAVPAADPNYTYTLADPNQPTNAAATVKIGSAEIQILVAVVAAVRSVTNVGLSYNADPGSFDFNAQAPASIFAQTAISPAQYVPTGSFLTLMPDGAARLTNVKNELNVVANSGIAAIEAVKNRNNAGYLINPGTVVSTAQLNNAETQIQAAQAYLAGPQNVTFRVNDQSVTVSVNVSAFLNNPPADLKALLPTLPVQTDSSGNTFLTDTGFPDPTFAGIFPNGIPVNQATGQQFFVGSSGNYNSISYATLASYAIGGISY